MAGVCAYRGPDGIHYWIQGQVGLANLALNTTRESLREKQPLSRDVDCVCLTADARVDNRAELIQLLTVKGCLADLEPTDADLIVAAYLCWGENCPIYILGDFAFAIWDARQRHLFCARDTVGGRPLHYSRMKDVLCIASEAQQILQHPGVPRQLDDVAMSDYLSWNWHDEDRSMFRDVRMLPPGFHLTVSRSQTRVRQYWEVDRTVRTVYRSEEEYAEHFLEIFSRVVSDRLRTQSKTIGVFMSGGLDSCSIAAVAQRTLKARKGGAQLIAYSHFFNRLRGCDERRYSGTLAEYLGMEIEYVDAERCGLLGDPLGFGSSLEVPITGYEPVMQCSLRKASEHGARVMLTGLAGPYSCLANSAFVYAHRLLRGEFSVFSELSDYAKDLSLPFYRVLYACLFRYLIPRGADHFLRRVAGRRPDWPALEWISPDFASRTGLSERLARKSEFLSRINTTSSPKAPMSLRNIDVGRSVYQWDRFVSTWGMESRHPYLDRRLFEFLLSIPPEQVFKGSWNRLVIRRSMQGILPDEIRLRRDKTNTEPFVHLVLRDRAVPLIRPLLKETLLCKLGIVDGEKLCRAYEDYVAERRTSGFLGAIALELWLREYQGVDL